jgi:hypothetical protein
VSRKHTFCSEGRKRNHHQGVAILKPFPQVAKRDARNPLQQRRW